MNAGRYIDRKLITLGYKTITKKVFVTRHIAQSQSCQRHLLEVILLFYDKIYNRQLQLLVSSLTFNSYLSNLTEKST